MGTEASSGVMHFVSEREIAANGFVDATIADLIEKRLVYHLEDDPYECIARTFPDHPDRCFVVHFFITSPPSQVRDYMLMKNGQIAETLKYGTFDGIRLFDTYEDAIPSAKELEQTIAGMVGYSLGQTVVVEHIVGEMPEPKGGRN